MVEALSDNNARAAATVREVVKKGGAKMADSGSVLFNFKRFVLPRIRKPLRRQLVLACLSLGEHSPFYESLLLVPPLSCRSP